LVPRINVENAVVCHLACNFVWVHFTIIFFWPLPLPVLSHICSTTITSGQLVSAWRHMLAACIYNSDMMPESCNLTICGPGFAEHIAKVTRLAVELRLRSSEGLNNHENREINCSTWCLLFGMPKPASVREITERIWQKTEDKQKLKEVRSEVFILCGVVIVTFRVLSLLVVTKCYSYSKIVLQLIVVPPGEYPINWIISSGTH
jgi:hypothetical protein